MRDCCIRLVPSTSGLAHPDPGPRRAHGGPQNARVEKPATVLIVSSVPGREIDIAAHGRTGDALGASRVKVRRVAGGHAAMQASQGVTVLASRAVRAAVAGLARLPQAAQVVATVDGEVGWVVAMACHLRRDSRLPAR